MKPGVGQRQREAASSNSPTRQMYNKDDQPKKCLLDCTRRPSSPEETCSTFVLVCGWVAPAALLMYCGNRFWDGFRVAGQMCRKKSRSPHFLYVKPWRHAQPHQAPEHVLPFFSLLRHDRYSATRPYQSFWSSLAGDHVVFSTVTSDNFFQLPNSEIAVLRNPLYCYWWQPSQLQEKFILAIYSTVTSSRLFLTSRINLLYNSSNLFFSPITSSRPFKEENCFQLFSLLLLVVSFATCYYFR